MTPTVDLHRDYDSYLAACRTAQQSPMPFNAWLLAKLIDLERRIAASEAEIARNRDDGR